MVELGNEEGAWRMCKYILEMFACGNSSSGIARYIYNTEFVSAGIGIIVCMYIRLSL